MHTDSGNLVSRRRPGTDPDDVSSNVHRAGTNLTPALLTGSKDNSQSGYMGDTLSTASSWTAPACGASTSAAASAPARTARSSRSYDGQGKHQLPVADADGDGRDGTVHGSMAVDGGGPWTARNGHGDAVHVGDLDTSRPGLEEFKVDASSSTAPASTSTAPRPRPVCRPAPASTSDHGAKATPSLSGDVLGDRREEAVRPTTDNTALRICSTPYETTTRITTLLHDPQYGLQPTAAPESLHRRRDGDATGTDDPRTVTRRRSPTDRGRPPHLTGPASATQDATQKAAQEAGHDTQQAREPAMLVVVVALGRDACLVAQERDVDCSFALGGRRSRRGARRQEGQGDYGSGEDRRDTGAGRFACALRHHCPFDGHVGPDLP